VRANPRQEGEAHVVAPLPADSHVAARKAFPHESRAADERERSPIGGLHVRFQPMQPQLLERDAKHELEPFRHVAVAGMRSESVIAKVSAVEEAPHDLADVEHATSESSSCRHTRSPTWFGGGPARLSSVAYRRTKAA
jgi:hypothetical protein